MAEISLYDRLETKFTHNGIILSNALSCTIEEELNGKYLLELTYPIDEQSKWENLVEENIIKADGQLFRIHSTEKDLSYVYVYARHIFYDLLHNMLEDVRPTEINGSGALNWILSGTQYPHNFIGMSDISGLNTQYYIRKNPVEAMLGPDSLVTRWGGELDRDNFNIRLLRAKGKDKGSQITYGKNMLGLEVTRDMDTVITRIMPQGRDELLLPEMYVDSPLINNYTFPRIAKIEFDIGVDEDTTEEQACVLMRAACNKLYSENKVDLPYVNIDTDLLLLENTEEYKDVKNLVKVSLGDIVSCTDNPINVNFKSKVIRIKKDILINRNVEVELGQFKQGISDTLNNAIKDISEDIQHSQSNLEKAIENATERLTNALGGHVVKRPGELLIMDTDDVDTATMVWRWNSEGLGHSSTGINGPYPLAMTIDGKIVADFVTTGTLDAGLVKTGVLTSNDTKTWINLDSGDFNFRDKIKMVGDTLTIELEDKVTTTVKGQVIKFGDINTRLGSIEANMSFNHMQDTAPLNPEIGDVWFSTSNEVFIVDNLSMKVNDMIHPVWQYSVSLNRSYRWTGETWLLVEDSAITELRTEVSQTTQTTGELTSRVVATETNLETMDVRIFSAEQKITPESITNIVESNSTKFTEKSTFEQTSGEIIGRIENSEDDIAEIKLTAEQLTTRIEDPETGYVSKLNQRAGQIETIITDLDGLMDIKYKQSTIPTDPQIGDVWVCITKNLWLVNNLSLIVEKMENQVNYYGNSLNESYRWNGTIWEHIEKGSISDLKYNASKIEQTIDKIDLEVRNQEGDIGNLELTTKGLTSRITGAEGGLSVVGQEVDSFKVRVEGVDGYVSEFRQTDKDIKTLITNDKRDFTEFAQDIRGFQTTVGKLIGVQYRQDTIPTNPKVGDIWVCTIDNAWTVGNLTVLVNNMNNLVDEYGNSLNNYYKWNGVKWVYLEDGDILDLKNDLSQITQNIDKIELKVQKQDGRVGQLEVTADSINSKVHNNHGQFSRFQQEIDNFVFEINDPTTGKVSILQQEVDNFMIRVEGKNDGKGVKYSQLTTNVNEINGVVYDEVIGNSKLSQTIGAITSRVEDIDGAYGELKVMKDSISARVEKKDFNGDAISSMVTLTPTHYTAISQNITLKASQIDLTGITTIYHPTDITSNARFVGDQFTLTYSNKSIFRVGVDAISGTYITTTTSSPLSFTGNGHVYFNTKVHFEGGVEGLPSMTAKFA